MLSIQGFGKRLREQRKKCKLTQLDLSERLKVSIDTLRRWENDVRLPRTDELVMICRLFDVSSDYLIGLTEKNEEMAEIKRHGFAIGRKIFLEIPENTSDDEIQRMLRISGIKSE